MCKGATFRQPAAFDAMASDSEVDDLLAAFDSDQDDEYEDDLESQVPVDANDIQEFDENTMNIDSDAHDVLARSANRVSSKQNSTKTVFLIPGDEVVIDVEDYSPEIELLRSSVNM